MTRSNVIFVSLLVSQVLPPSVSQWILAISASIIQHDLNDVQRITSLKNNNHGVVCGVWCVVCGVWCVVCGVWCVVCGVWCVVCGVCLCKCVCVCAFTCLRA